MGFPEWRTMQQNELVDVIRDGNQSGLRFCFILGSGASVESGITSGNSLEMEWMNELEPRLANVRNLAEALKADNKIQYPFNDIEKAWRNARDKGEKTLPSKYYFDIYKLRYFNCRQAGYAFLEKLMEGKEPSMGYRALALLLTKSVNKDGRDNLRKL